MLSTTRSKSTITQVLDTRDSDIHSASDCVQLLVKVVNSRKNIVLVLTDSWGYLTKILERYNIHWQLPTNQG